MRKNEGTVDMEEMRSSGNGGLRERESKGTVDMEELWRARVMEG